MVSGATVDAASADGATVAETTHKATSTPTAKPTSRPPTLTGSFAVTPVFNGKPGRPATACALSSGAELGVLVLALLGDLAGSVCRQRRPGGTRRGQRERPAG